jgi:hypothetical protein
MVIGLAHPRRDRQGAAASSQRVQEFTRLFCQQNRSISCRELLGHDISTPACHEAARAAGVFQTICPKLVGDAATILEQVL